MGMIRLDGNTYPVKNKLKALGGVWKSASKCWVVPIERLQEAKDLVESAGAKPLSVRAPRVCADCGCRINYGRFCGKCEYR